MYSLYVRDMVKLHVGLIAGSEDRNQTVSSFLAHTRVPAARTGHND